jgi:Flp pilus assembly protein TadB
VTFIQGLQLAIKIAPWAALSVFALMWWIAKEKAKKERIRAEKAELAYNASQANIKRANATLQTMADNMERLKDEKSRIAKADLDELIGIIHDELPDVVRKEYADGSGDGRDSADSDAPVSVSIISG